MGNLFGGGSSSAPNGSFQSAPNPYIPNDALLTSVAQGLIQPSLYHAWQPYRTAQYAAGDWNPQTMGMNIPQFDPAMFMPQNNPWTPQQPLATGLGAYSYVPPGANSMYNPVGGFQGLASMPPVSQAPQGQPQQGQPQNPAAPSNKPDTTKSKPDSGGTK